VDVRPDASSFDSRSIAVWYCFTERLGDGELRALDTLLGGDEPARRDRFVFARDRRDFAAAHGLTRWALWRRAGLRPQAWAFKPGAHGKPAPVPQQAGTPRLEFNLSHTHGLVACAVTRGASVGLDVECVARLGAARDIAGHCFAPSELRWLDEGGAGGYAVRFTELWTLKEAYLKALGDGLRVPLDSFAFHVSSAGAIALTPAPRGNWQFLLAAPSPDTRLAVAARLDEASGRRPIVISDFDGKE
jgi:4'-phosphopantetheinyl transferase